jgi:uncharacterized protein UPF0175
MKTLTIEYADSLPDTLHLTSGEFEREAKMAMAVKLFDVGRLISGRLPTWRASRAFILSTSSDAGE